LFSLATASSGEHVLTLSVTPDNLGPVTVRAHVSAAGVRVELFAPNDLGRDALRAILPELRRDLAGTGMNANLQLSSNNQPTGTGTGTGSGAQTGGQAGSGQAGSGLSGDADGAGAGRDGASTGSTNGRGASAGSSTDVPHSIRSTQPGRHSTSIDVMA
jgi:flagellar hook-length control protein FliK